MLLGNRLCCEKSPTFDEALEFFWPYDLCLHLNLKRHENREEELVLLVDATHCVGEC